MGIHKKSAGSKEDKIVDLYNEGYGLWEIADETDTSIDYVKASILRAGLPIENGHISKKFAEEFSSKWNKARLRILNSKKGK